MTIQSSRVGDPMRPSRYSHAAGSIGSHTHPLEKNNPGSEDLQATGTDRGRHRSADKADLENIFPMHQLGFDY